MRIKLDENLPASLASLLAQEGHNADTVPDEGLTGQPDSRIWEAVKSDNRFLITQDLDFSDLRQVPTGTHPGVLVVRLAQPSRRALIKRIREIFAVEAVNEW